MALLDTLRGHLQSMVRDPDNEVWTEDEMDAALQRAVIGLYPRVASPLDPTAHTITLVSGTYYYHPPSSAVEIDRLEWVDTDGNERGELSVGSWEVKGDTLTGSAYIHVAPSIADSGGTLRVHGVGRYRLVGTLSLDDGLYLDDDLSLDDDSARDFLLPELHYEIVLNRAEVELLHYLKADRARFMQWQNTRQDQNVSVNELLQAINASEQRASATSSKWFTWRKPKPGRR